MLSPASSSTSLISSSLIGCASKGPSSDHSTDRLALQDGPHVAAAEQVDHDDREGVVHAQRYRGGVHRLEAPVEHVEVAHLGDERGLQIGRASCRERVFSDGYIS